MKKTLACAVVAAAIVLGSGGAAMAGETRGNGDPNENSGSPHSACHFSGLDQTDADEQPQAPEENDDALAVRGSQKHGYHGVQNWGTYARAGADDFLTSIGLHPGEACSGNAEH